jgi:hypothetical protein
MGKGGCGSKSATPARYLHLEQAKILSPALTKKLKQETLPCGVQTGLLQLRFSALNY